MDAPYVKGCGGVMCDVTDHAIMVDIILEPGWFTIYFLATYKYQILLCHAKNDPQIWAAK